MLLILCTLHHPLCHLLLPHPEVVGLVGLGLHHPRPSPPAPEGWDKDMININCIGHSSPCSYSPRDSCAYSATPLCSCCVALPSVVLFHSTDGWLVLVLLGSRPSPPGPRRVGIKDINLNYNTTSIVSATHSSCLHPLCTHSSPFGSILSASLVLFLI